MYHNDPLATMPDDEYGAELERRMRAYLLTLDHDVLVDWQMRVNGQPMRRADIQTLRRFDHPDDPLTTLPDDEYRLELQRRVRRYLLTRSREQLVEWLMSASDEAFVNMVLQQVEPAWRAELLAAGAGV